MGAESLYRYLEENSANEIRIEVPVRDEDYNELALHADTVFVPTLLVAIEYVGPILNLLVSWLQLRQLRRFDRTDVEMEMVVENRRSGRRKALKYSGPAKDFHDTLKAAVDGLNQLQDDD